VSLTVAVPDRAMLDRLAAAEPDVDLLEWTPGAAALPRPVDLLVVPYTTSFGFLSSLAGQPVGVVQSQSLGYDGVADALPDGMLFCNAVGVHEAPTAELAVALILSAQRGLRELALNQARGSWDRAVYPGLAGSSVLIVGVGGVGEQVRRRIEPFDVTVTRVARTARDDEHGRVHALGDLASLMADADIVVIAVPLSDSTRHLVDDDLLGRMRPGALLVNVSRGPIVDTDALVKHVRAGRVRAALDVVDPEPLPAGHPLWSLDGVTISPHLGGNVASMPARIDPLIREQLGRLARGLPPVNIVAGTDAGETPPQTGS
jgi:phosphoglycerate dehydrogenase-like enzyme